MGDHLNTLLAVREARSVFYGNILETVRAAKPELTRDDVFTLTQDGTLLLGELLYIFDVNDLTDPKRLREWLNRHNSDMDALAKEESGIIEDGKHPLTKGGIRKSRIKEATLSEAQINFIIHECRHGTPTFDQTTLGKLLVQSMSPATTRKLAILLAQGGLVTRTEVRYALISANGRLEAHVRNYLDRISEAASKKSNYAAD